MNSPVLPAGTRPWTPAARRWSMWALRRGPSILVLSSVKGVIRATMIPVRDMLAVLFLCVCFDEV